MVSGFKGSVAFFLGRTAAGPSCTEICLRRALLVTIRIAVAAVLTVLAVSFLGFAGYDKPKDLTRIETAIVFTGADERVRVGLELLKAGLVKRLYISGANPNAGIWLHES